MTKPIVRYSDYYVTPPAVGRSAYVFIVDAHPVLGTVKAPKWVYTSPVQSVQPDGSFETLNTIYKKA
jgi:hypothetical protein